MSALHLDEFVPEASPEAPSAHASARFPEVTKSALHLVEFPLEVSPEAPPAYTSLSNGWRVTVIVGGGLVLGVILSYFLFISDALNAAWRDLVR